jgi:hypothetical protein
VDEAEHGQQGEAEQTAGNKNMPTTRPEHSMGRVVTPEFPKKTKCKPICMPGSSFMHIVTYK